MSDLVEQLWQGINAGKIVTDRLPVLTVGDGQRLQQEILARWQAQGETLAGYKVALTSGAARNAFGEGIRPFGYLLQSRVFRSGDTIARARVGNMGLENELVFRVGKDLQGPGVTPAEARAAMMGVAPGFEINQDRGAGKTTPGIRVAENLSQWGIVVGDFCTPPTDLDDLVVTLSLNSVPLQTVAATNHIDNHYESICALVAQLHHFDRQLKAGDLIITGSFTRLPVESGGTYTGDFGKLGRVSIEVIV